MPSPEDSADPTLTTTILVRTELAGAVELAYDFMILQMPDDLIQPRPYTPAGAATSIALRELSHREGNRHLVKRLQLREAQWWVTRSIEVVAQRANGHCATCNAGIDQARALMAEHPDAVLAVGRFSFARRS